ncbi:MAG: hypothetical protein D6805_09905 [Planctomycetota bacterium]|nr:MAG: hypothetical protein D6805_09905 [Planctomycetota bacterium]
MLFFLKRMGQKSMKVVSQYCEKCGVKIELKDKESDKVKGRLVCKDCKKKEEEVGLEERGERAKGKEEKRHKKKKKKKKRSLEAEAGEGRGAEEKKRKKKKKKKSKDSEQKEGGERAKRKKEREGEKPKKKKKKKKGSAPAVEEEREAQEKGGREKKKKGDEEAIKRKEKGEKGEKTSKNRGAKSPKGEKKSEDGKRKTFLSKPMLVGAVAMGLLVVGGYFWLGRSSPQRSPQEREKGIFLAQQHYIQENPTEYEENLRRLSSLLWVLKTGEYRKKVKDLYAKVAGEYSRYIQEQLEKDVQAGRYEGAFATYYSYGDWLPQKERGQMALKLEKLERERLRRFLPSSEEVAQRLMEEAKAQFRQKKYSLAIATLQAYDEDIFGKSKSSQELGALLERYRAELAERRRLEQLHREAKGYYEEMVESVKKHLEKKEFSQALVLLRRFPKEYSSTEYGQKVQQLIQSVLSKMNAYLSKKLSAVEWEPLIGPRQNNLFNWTLTDPPQATGVFTCKGGVMRARNRFSRPVFQGTGYANWKDYLVEFEVRVLSGTYLFAVRYYQKMRQRRMVRRGPLIYVPPYSVSSQWRKVQYLILGKTMRFRLFEGGSWGAWRELQPHRQSGYSPLGAVGFYAVPGADFEVRGMRIKVISKGNWRQ